METNIIDIPLAIIPARGGSVGIRKKNLHQINGIPLIQYTLNILRKMEDKLIPFISTDDVEIHEYCEKNGFNNKYIRPTKLAGNNSKIVDAVLDACNWWEVENKKKLKTVMLLQPTSPFRRVQHVINAIEKYQKTDKSSLVSVCKMIIHPNLCIDASNNKWNFLDHTDGTVINRQNLSSAYYQLNGAIYISTIEQLRNKKRFVIPGETELFKMDQYSSIDIDDIDDIEYAEYLISSGKVTI